MKFANINQLVSFGGIISNLASFGIFVVHGVSLSCVRWSYYGNVRASFEIEHSTVRLAKKIHIRKSLRAAPYHTRAFVRLSLSSFLLFPSLSSSLFVFSAASYPRCNVSGSVTTHGTALIILLFSNESVDADGSAPAHKMHGTGCVSPSPPPLLSFFLSFSLSFVRSFVSLKSPLLPMPVETEQGRKRERERERERVPQRVQTTKKII